MTVYPASNAFKDLFSAGATSYARFRPRYPAALFRFLADVAGGRSLAVDVGAGNGQAALGLAAEFERVLAVEPSVQQLAAAEPHPRLQRLRSRAEALPIAADSVQLVLAAQAFHWFAAPRFFAEVGRVLRPGAVLALCCYQLPVIAAEVDQVVGELYALLDPYWEPERRLVEEGYRSVPAPFPELEVPAFEMRQRWSFPALLGYLGTWSPLPRYRRAEGRDPLAAFAPRLEAAWQAAGGGDLEVTFPLVVRAFRRGSASDP